MTAMPGCPLRSTLNLALSVTCYALCRASMLSRYAMSGADPAFLKRCFKSGSMRDILQDAWFDFITLQVGFPGSYGQAPHMQEPSSQQALALCLTHCLPCCGDYAGYRLCISLCVLSRDQGHRGWHSARVQVEACVHLASRPPQP